MKKPLIIVSLCLVLAACADVTSAALEVNGTSFDRSELTDILSAVDEEVTADEALGAQIGSPPGIAVTDLVHPVLNLVIQNEAFRQDLAARGLDVTADDIEAARAFSQPTGSATVDDILAALNARLTVYESIGVNPGEFFSQIEVDLDPRYGTWSSVQGAVIPNAAPAVERSGP